jgi:hypothetical protein
MTQPTNSTGSTTTGAMQPPADWPTLIGATLVNGINKWIDVEVIRNTPPATPARDPAPPTPQGAVASLGPWVPLLLIGAVVLVLMRR